MKKKGHRPLTRVKNPEPNVEDPDWVIWAAWADRITFEEIEKRQDIGSLMLLKLCGDLLNPHHFDYGEKEFMKKVLNTEKNLNILENKLLVN